ncbi:acyl-CoA N-acyltransferase [Spinellus fusiger]|nr:acyl-CoA N-acyltransferase [Spinellus fusiger]
MPDSENRSLKVQIGSVLMDVWYLAPYPEEYSQLEVLYLCEFCLKYIKSAYVARRHKLKCPAKHPPGNEIYRDGALSVFEVDGRKNKIYCQNLCLLAKMFLDHKTLYYDVEPFLFYILTETNEKGCHFVGYFSKEKSAFHYNLSCIMTLPHHQCKGYGQFLIDLSYLLSRKEKKCGSPEKPLSDLGLLSYRKYWKYALTKALQSAKGPLTLQDLSTTTAISLPDILSTLKLNHMLYSNSEGHYEFVIPMAPLPQGRLVVHPELLTWTPYLVTIKKNPIVDQIHVGILEKDTCNDPGSCSTEFSSSTLSSPSDRMMLLPPTPNASPFSPKPSFSRSPSDRSETSNQEGPEVEHQITRKRRRRVDDTKDVESTL